MDLSPPLGMPPDTKVPMVAVAARKKPFPEGLHDLVNYCDENHNTVLKWADDGVGFVVLDRRQFEFHILPLFFRHGKFTSLERQLANYGFRREGRGMGAYRDEGQFFRRDHPEGAKYIRLKKSNGKRSREEAAQVPAPAPAGTTTTVLAPAPATAPAPTEEGPNKRPRIPSANPGITYAAAPAEQTAAGSVPLAPAPASLSMLAAAASLPSGQAPSGAITAEDVPRLTTTTTITTTQNAATAETITRPAGDPVPLRAVPDAPQGTGAQVSTHVSTAPVADPAAPIAGQWAVAAPAAQTPLPPVSATSSSVATPTWSMPVYATTGKPFAVPLTDSSGSSTMTPPTSSSVLPTEVLALSRHFLSRVDISSTLITKLLETIPIATNDEFMNFSNNHASFALGVTGFPGVGKSTMASVVVRDASVRSFFSDGISWIKMKERRKISTLKQLLLLYKRIISHVRLTDPECQAPSFEEFSVDGSGGVHDEECVMQEMQLARGLMAAFMVHRKTLVVLDNVYHKEDMEWFNFGRNDEEGSPYRLLFTTRLRSLRGSPTLYTSGFPWEDVPLVTVFPLSLEDAVKLLERESGRYQLSSQEQECARRIVQQCGCVPTLLQIAGRFTSSEQPNSLTYADVATNLRHLLKTADDTLQKNLDKTFRCVQDEATGATLKNVFHKVAQSISSWSSSSSSASGFSQWMSFDVMKRYVDSLPDPNQLHLEHLEGLSSAVWADKVVVALSALTSLGLLSVRTTEQMGQSKVFEYSLANPVLEMYAENMAMQKLEEA